MAALREQLELNDEFISTVIEGLPVKAFVGTDRRPPDSLDMIEMGFRRQPKTTNVKLSTTQTTGRKTTTNKTC
jgi:hypothetical protein